MIINSLTKIVIILKVPIVFNFQPPRPAAADHEWCLLNTQLFILLRNTQIYFLALDLFRFICIHKETYF